MNNKLTQNQLSDKIREVQKVVILSHRNPDGDAIGSSLSMKYILEKQGKEVQVILPSEYPVNMEWMFGIEEVMVYDLKSEDSLETIKQAEMIFCLDFNALSRIDKMGDTVAESKAIKVLIDHHLSPEDFADFMLSETEASSTCELIFDFVEMMGWEKDIDSTFAELMYVGLLTDTGTYSYAVSPKTFRLAAKMLEYGVNHVGVQDNLFNSQEEKNLRLLGYCLYERMEILYDYKTAIISLSKEDYKNFGIQRGDTEGIVNFALRLKDVTMAVLVMEQPNIVKLSFRSKGNHSVEVFAREQFKGGGHPNASGGQSYFPLKSTIAKIKSLLPQYAPN